MIFVYPSVISENVPEHLYPAIAKTLEQFYLFHVLESFGNGTLRVKTIYNDRTKVYGPLILEGVIPDSNYSILTEADVKIPSELIGYVDNRWDSKLADIQVYTNSSIQKYQKEFNEKLYKTEADYEQHINDCQNDLYVATGYIDVLRREILKHADERLNDINIRISGANDQWLKDHYKERRKSLFYWKASLQQ